MKLVVGDSCSGSGESSLTGFTGLDNVANVQVLPIPNANSQLETGTGNWRHSHNDNIQQG